jgi:probable F420-dependent oxidoreductase
MDIGLFVIANNQAMNIVELAKEAESRGFDSLWIPEHSHLPTASKYPGGLPIPKDYAHTYDPFVTLSAMASVTSKIKLATGICLIIERDTIFTAKQVATLDQVSNGRFEFGIGAGWNRIEMEHHGTDYTSRFRRMKEQVVAMKTVWKEEEASFSGEFVNFESMWSWPKPLQTPHPPIWLGGESIHTLRRIVDYCDGWLPRVRDAEKVLEGMGTLKQLAQEAGRDIPVSAFAMPPKLASQFRDAGAQRAILMLPAAGRDKTLATMDQYAELIIR